MNYLYFIYSFLSTPKFYMRSRKELLAYREARFREILKYAYTHSEFYRACYTANGIKAGDLATIPIMDLPILKKAQFRENFDALVTSKDINTQKLEAYANQEKDLTALYLDKYFVVHSSGSTGKPTYYVYDTGALASVAAKMVDTARHTPGYKGFMRKALHGVRTLFIAATNGRFAGAATASLTDKIPLNKVKLLNINLPLEQWRDIIVCFKPNFISGYPSALKLLCELMEREHLQLELLRVISVGEPLTHVDRQYLESVFKINITNMYGASESLAMGVEATREQGMFLFDDLNYFEFANGCTYITTLYNYTQPLIRYALSDIIQPAENSPDQIPPYTKINKIMGRDEELLWFTNMHQKKDFLHPLIIDDIDVQGLKNFQYIQYSDEKFAVNIVPEKGADLSALKKGIRAQLDTLLREKQFSNLIYDINVVEQIPFNPKTGKQNLIIKQKAGEEIKT